MRKVRNKLRAFLQLYAGKLVRSYLWNAEFSGGRWDCLDITTGDCVYPYIEKYACHGSILDLGCGSGSTANELTLTSYEEYIGVDISTVALEKARKRTDEACRARKNSYFQSDISSFVPIKQFDVILFRDSIYYVPRNRIKTMLERYSTCLKETGVFIVRMWDGNHKFKPIMDAIDSNFEIVEKCLFNHPNAVIIVFRPSRGVRT